MSTGYQIEDQTSSLPLVCNDRGFTLHEHYDHMQIINMNARMYDPLMGQFISVDPLADKYPGWGPYVYCMNNPLLYLDPDGEEVWKSTKGNEVTFVVIAKVENKGGFDKKDVASWTKSGEDQIEKSFSGKSEKTGINYKTIAKLDLGNEPNSDSFKMDIVSSVEDYPCSA